MEPYYETVEKDSKMFVLSVAHKNMEDALDYAESHDNVIAIHEVGVTWDDFFRCPICKEWVLSCEVGSDGICEDCLRARKDHGF